MSGQALEQAAQGGGGVTIPGSVQETCSCGTLGHGLVGMVVLGWQLDLMSLEIFSNLWFYDKVHNLEIFIFARRIFFSCMSLQQQTN